MTRNTTQTLCALVLVALLATTVSFGQEASSQEIEDLKKDIQSLKAGQKAIQLQLQQISNQIKTMRALTPAKKPSPPKEFTLNVGKRPFKGNEAAGLTLVEFSDYQ